MFSERGRRGVPKLRTYLGETLEITCRSQMGNVVFLQFLRIN